MQKKKVIILAITLSVLVIGGTGGIFLGVYLKFKHLFVPCIETPFNAFPVEMERIKSITPLGNLNPPAHTFPTDHIYFNIDPLYTNGFEIYAPGEITIHRIRKVTYDPPQGGIKEDFAIEFDVCRYVSGMFGHVNNLSADILATIGEFGEEYGDTVYEYDIGGRHFTSYIKEVNVKTATGTRLGRAGFMGGFDFWMKDKRVVFDWVNKEWTDEYQHTTCPLAYFAEDLQAEMKAKLLDWSGEPIEPAGYCGRIAFDVANTAQGIWVRDDWTNREEECGLALVYNNFNASQGAISIGYALNSTWDASVYLFTPKNDGLMNRNFSQITNDGKIYYYYCNGFQFDVGYDKVILIKMDGDRELYLQFIDKSGTLLPSDPTTLFDETKAVHYSR